MPHVLVTHRILARGMKPEAASVDVSERAALSYQWICGENLSIDVSEVAGHENNRLVSLVHPKGVYKKIECSNEPGDGGAQSAVDKILRDFDAPDFGQWLLVHP
jgi:hypothetical protein